MKVKNISKLVMILLAFCLLLGGVACSSKISSKSIELLPQDADLNKAPDVIVEPEKEPYNLGGWRPGNTVSWEVEIPEEASYKVAVNYSRPGQYEKTSGIINVLMADGNTAEINFDVLPSGKNKDKDDWSVYIDNDSCGIDLPAGTTEISVSPNIDMSSSHFINLRSITFTKK